MTDVVLVDCLGERREGRRRMENLGLGYLAAALEAQGFSVAILDANFYYWSPDAVATQVLAHGPLLAGFCLFFNNTAESLALVRSLRTKGMKTHITLGGHHATFNFRDILLDNPGVDSIIRGEGEAALTELATRLRDKKPWKDLANLAYRDHNGEIRHNPCRPLCSDLDRLPHPSRKTYAEALRETRTASLVSSRGCLGDCSFCSLRAFSRLATGKRWRGHSAAYIADEMQTLVEHYGITHFNFVDDDFFGPGRQRRERALNLAYLLSQRGLKATFLVSCRPDNLPEDALKALQQAGLICVDIGAESFTSGQLARYHKKVSVAQNWQAIETLARTGLEYRVYLIPFDPYVTLAELSENLQAIKQVGVRHLLDMFAFSHLRVFQGTPMEERLRRDGLLQGEAGRALYQGELKYKFAHPEVSTLFGQWYAIQPVYAELMAQARHLFDFETPSEVEEHFSLRLQLLLKQTILDLWVRVVAACREQPGAALEEMLQAEMAGWQEALAAMEEARTQNRFRHMALQTFRLGGHTIFYPSEEIYILGQQLAAQLAEAEQ